MSKYLFQVSNLANITLLSSLFLLSVFIFPFAEQFVTQSKAVIILLTAFIFVFLYALHTFFTKVIEIPNSPLLLPILGFLGAVAISTISNSQYPLKHLLGMGGVYISFSIIVLLASLLIKKASLVQLSNVLNGATFTVLSASLLQLIGFGPSFIFNNLLSTTLPTQTLSLNLAGSPLIAMQLGMLASIAYGLRIYKTKNKSVFSLLILIVLIGHTLFHGWLSLPQKVTTPLIMPWAVNWSIALDTLRSPKSAIVGFGPESFATASTTLKPAWTNATQQWFVTFIQGSNTILTLIVTTGLLGVIAFISILVAIFKEYKKSHPETKPYFVLTAVTVLFLLIFPPNTVLFGFLAVCISYVLINEQKRYTKIELKSLQSSFQTNQESTQLHAKNEHKYQNFGFVISFCVVLIAITALSFFWFAKSIRAESLYFASLRANQENDVVAAYQLQQKAIALNPYNDAYRRAFSSSSIAIAAALAQNEELSDTENQQFSELIQQAIQEGRSATIIDPANAANWIVLAGVYKSLIGVVDEADRWAVTTYLNGIQAAPQDPGIRIELGLVLYTVEKYQEAAQFFQQAINLKPDLPNGYYNLANALVKIEQYSLARIAYQQTLLLLQPDYEGYIVAAEELEKLEKLMESLGLLNEDSNTETTGPITREEDSKTEPPQNNTTPNTSNTSQTEQLLDSSILTKPQEPSLNIENSFPVTP
jgi:tetratricopeptide (TPR) repeat protein